MVAPQNVEEPQSNSADQIAIGFGVIGILTILLVSLPPVILDLGLSLNLTISLLVLLVALYVRSPLELSPFGHFASGSLGQSTVRRKSPCSRLLRASTPLTTLNFDPRL